MYTDYFGLTEKPFAIAPNPRYLYLSELHREALAHLLYGINGEGCIVLFTGEIGAGKTTVCRCLLEQLPADTDVAVILNPKLRIDELLKTICEELNIPQGEDPLSIKESIDRLNQYLLDAHARGRNTALIIDEAQNLNVDLLEQLRLLTNLETNTSKLLQVVLIGQPELREILKVPSLAQLNQRITTRYHLQPLDQSEVESYIRHRLQVAGRGNARYLFSPAAIRYVAKASKGIPRLINILCDRALLGAYAENRTAVDLAIIRKAARELSTTDRSVARPTAWRLVVATMRILLTIAIPAGLYLASHYRDFPVLDEMLRPLTGGAEEPDGAAIAPQEE
jgi:general secretion pathway protein A